MSYEFRHTLTHFYACTYTCKPICVWYICMGREYICNVYKYVQRSELGIRYLPGLVSISFIETRSLARLGVPQLQVV